jgi:hypothetical protein
MHYNFAFMKKLRCFLTLTCVLAALPVYADGDLTLFGAAQHQGKLTLEAASSAATTINSFDPGTFGTFGLRFGGGSVLGHEHTIGYTPNFLGGDAKAVIYNSDILIQLPLPKVKPYGTAGLGAIFSFGGGDGGQSAISNIGTRFALNYGGGIKIFPGEPVGVRFDIRGYAVPSVKFNLPLVGNPANTVVSSGETLNILEIGLGIVFRF